MTESRASGPRARKIEVDLYALQRLMTRKSPMMTQRYAHLHDETLKRGANVTGKIVAAVAAEFSEAESK